MSGKIFGFPTETLLRPDCVNHKALISQIISREMAGKCYLLSGIILGKGLGPQHLV